MRSSSWVTAESLMPQVYHNGGRSSGHGRVPFSASLVKLVAVRSCSHRKGTVFRMRDCIAIVGVGLIGGSLAAAVKRYGVARRVLGIGRNPERLQGAHSAGLIDAWSTDPATVAEAELTVVCTPVDRIADDVKALWPSVRASSLVTDAGSTKRQICEDLAACLDKTCEFVGSHPIAGSHRQGFEAADPELYAGRVCVVTPAEHSTATAVEQTPALKSFLEGVTMTEREFQNALERNGIKRVDPLNEPFNPHLHQAVSEMERPDVPSGTVVMVYQAGYTIEDRVLRPAMVVVGKGGARAAPVPAGNGEQSASPQSEGPST